MRAFAVLSTLGAIVAGLWLLTTQPADSNSIFGPLLHAMGLYFIAKGLYMGPSLIQQTDTAAALRWLVEERSRTGGENDALNDE